MIEKNSKPNRKVNICSYTKIINKVSHLPKHPFLHKLCHYKQLTKVINLTTKYITNTFKSIFIPQLSQF